MKAGIYGIYAYVTPNELPATWPLAPANYDAEAGQRNFREGLEQLELADALGFEWVSFSEHHWSTVSMTPVPALNAASLLGRVRNLKLAVLGHHLPLNNPVRVAEELAMLDNLSDGRLVVGLLRGTPSEYQVYYVNPAETRERTTESMELILKAWTEPQPFSWEGRYYQYRTVSVWPRPVQQPFPPTYVLGNSAQSCEFAARHRLGIGVSFGTFAINGRSTSYYRECCEREGWTPTPEYIIYRGRMYVADSDAQAEEEARLHFDRPGGTSFLAPAVRTTVSGADPNPFHTGGASMPGRPDVTVPDAAGRRTLNFVGCPDTILKQILECRAMVGAGILDLWFQGPGMEHARVMRSIELFGKEVLPNIGSL